MKRIYRFEENENDYLIFKDQDEKYKISKENLKLDGTKFYEIFFNEYVYGDKIELTKGTSLDSKNKLSQSIFDTLQKLLDEISQKIDESQNE